MQSVPININQYTGGSKICWTLKQYNPYKSEQQRKQWHIFPGNYEV